MANDKNRPAADTRTQSYKAYRKAKKDLKEAQEKQEILQKSIEQYTPNETVKKEITIDYDLGDTIDFSIENKAIIINGKIDPKLDPGSSVFDPDLYAQYAPLLEEKYQKSLEKLQQAAEDLAKTYLDNTSDELKKMADSIKKAFSDGLFNTAADMLRSMTNTDSFNKMLKALQEAKGITEEWQQLEPYLEEELKKPEYNGMTLDQALDCFNLDGTPITDNEEQRELLNNLLAAARAARRAAAPVITINKRGVNETDYPLDKVNSNVWNMLTVADKDGQLTINFDMKKRGTKKNADLIFSINFDELKKELKITKKLTAFDKRCYIAAAALFVSGCEYMTIAQIYAAMGNIGRPSAKDIKKINDSITKMNAAHIYLNNESEHAVYKKYDKFIYDASLLPMERVSAIVNGQTAESAVHLFREPPLISFARSRGQITTVSQKLLQSPLNKTDANLQIDDYLIERISRMKSGKNKAANRILYNTIFDECNITTKMQRIRSKEKIITYLDYYKSCKFIKGYKTAADGITIIY